MKGRNYQESPIEYFSHHNVWNNWQSDQQCEQLRREQWYNLYGDVANGNHQAAITKHLQTTAR